MEDLDLTTLRLFVDVCEAKSIKVAAAQANINASAVTKRISKLEQQLDTVLLKRIKQGVTPTPQGALLSEHARRLINDANRISLQIAGKGTNYATNLTVAANSSNIASSLTDDLASFMALTDQCNTHLIVNEMISKDVVHSVRDGSATIGIIWDNTETSGLQHMPYKTERLAAVVKRGHPIAHESTITYEALMPYDMVVTKVIKHTEAMLRRTGAITGEHMRIRIEMETWESALRMVAYGNGVLICRENMAIHYAPQWDLAVVPLSNSWAQQSNKIIYKSHVDNPKAVQLIDYLTEQSKKI